MKNGKIVISIPEVGDPTFEFTGDIAHRTMSLISKRIKKEYLIYMRGISKTSMAEQQERYRVEQATEIARQIQEGLDSANQRLLEKGTQQSTNLDVIIEDDAITNETSEGEDNGQDDEGGDFGDAEGSGYPESIEKLFRK